MEPRAEIGKSFPDMQERLEILKMSWLRTGRQEMDEIEFDQSKPLFCAKSDMSPTLRHLIIFMFRSKFALQLLTIW
jgi:hypothetical protein